MTATVAPTSAELAAAKAVVAAAETAVSVTAKTIGQDVDAEVAKLKALGVKFETDVSAWFKANWPHIVTWVTLGGSTIVTVAKAALKLV